jgi:AmmeMemoRadiSam system protein B
VTTVRAPAVAGQFYPGDPDHLATMVDTLLDEADEFSTERGTAYVVPHAGYVYSGRTAASAYRQLRGYPIRRIVLIGPSHFHPLRGCAVPATPTWLTPLGPVTVDVEGCADLVEQGLAVRDDAPHRAEHSLEVQLPLLQRSIGAPFTVLPIVAGPTDTEAVAAVIAAAVARQPSRTVAVCSTDLSHYLDQDAARDRDAETVQAILARAPARIGVRDACGVYALRGLLAWATEVNAVPRLLHQSNSADASGDSSRVVGYAAVAFSDRQR